MKHLQAIQAYIQTLIKSTGFHALVIQSAPGWGKSSTVDCAVARLGIKAVSGGSYATPLHIYNTLCRNSESLIIFDDVAGLLSEVKAMAVLKAATWPSSGSGPAAQRRRVAWGSTSEKVEQPHFDFSGKLILLTNVIPATKETEAFLSRCLNYSIVITPDDAKEMLLAAADSEEHFPRTALAGDVARFLVSKVAGLDFPRVNLRTLKMGYDLAATHPEAWRELIVHLLPRHSPAQDPIVSILSSGLSAKEQETRFVAETGLSRRSYYYYKKRRGLTRSYGGNRGASDRGA